MNARTRIPRNPVKGWKAQSLLVHAHMTGPDSPARAEGLMPSYASAALDALVAVGRVAGLAKKRWRDGDATRLGPEDVRDARAAAMAAFDRLEAAIENAVDDLADGEAAGRVYGRHGMVGLIAIGLAEEACELAAPIARLARGEADLGKLMPEIADEDADVRSYQHLAATALGIDHTTTTQAKWERFLKRIPDVAARALAPRRLGDEEMRSAIACMAVDAAMDRKGRRK